MFNYNILIEFFKCFIRNEYRISTFAPKSTILYLPISRYKEAQKQLIQSLKIISILKKPFVINGHYSFINDSKKWKITKCIRSILSLKNICLVIDKFDSISIFDSVAVRAAAAQIILPPPILLFWNAGAMNYQWISWFSN